MSTPENTLNLKSYPIQVVDAHETLVMSENGTWELWFNDGTKAHAPMPPDQAQAWLSAWAIRKGKEFRKEVA